MQVGDRRIAIVGLSCEVPGASGPGEFWQLLSQGRSSVLDDLPLQRWRAVPVDKFGYSRALDYAAYLKDPFGFDASFFGISDTEAAYMDPQQRLALELAWAALEDAGLNPIELKDQAVGLFIGAMRDDFVSLISGSTSSLNPRRALGSLRSIIAARMSFFFGFTGPSIVIDTGQSSSLVAIISAMESLRRGECTLALAGGVHLNLDPNSGAAIAEMGVLSPDGQCRPFDQKANGYVRGEGGGFVVLKRVDRALEDGNRIYCQLLGGAVANDGARSGLAAPGIDGRCRLFRAALSDAGINASEVDYIEAHGTGTPAGDTAEARSVISVYSEHRPASSPPLFIGSAKPNVGHLEAAAGVIGVIKTALAINHEVIPSTLNFVSPNAALMNHDSTLRIPNASTKWPVMAHLRTAAVSSYGIGGTNAHLILQEAPTEPCEHGEPVPASTPPICDSPLYLWPVSARSPQALAAQAERLHRYLVDRPDLDLADVAYSLAVTRTHHPYRAAITARSNTENPRDDLLDGLYALASNQSHPQLTQHHHLANLASKTVFVFPGQGAQYSGMCVELYRHHRTFTATLDEMCAALDAHLDVPLREVIFAQPDSSNAELLNKTAYTQPALFAIGAAMYAVLTEAGITADYLLGHSIGELTAAYCAGAFSLADAAVLVCARGRLMQSCAPGAMLAVQVSEHAMSTVLNAHPGVSIAAVNSPTSTVISGHPDDLARIRDYCAANHWKSTPLAVSHAFHSAFMDPALPEFKAIAAGLTYRSPSVPIVSNLTGRIVTVEQLAASDYWTRHLREPVRFHDGVAGLLDAGEHTFVELSPHPVLAPAITETVAESAERVHSAVITTLRRDRPDLDMLATALAQLHNRGHSPSWRVLHPGARAISLPTYAFQHRSYCPAPSANADVRAAGLDRPGHPLLGSICELADQDQIVVSAQLSTSTHRWLTGHIIGDRTIFPATGFIDVLLHIGDFVACPVIGELTLDAPLVLDEHTPTNLQIAVHRVDDSGRRRFTVHARAASHDRSATAWALHATGSLSGDQPAAAGYPITPPAVEALDHDSFYQQVAERGIHWKSPFSSLRAIGHDAAHRDVTYAEVALPSDTDVAGYGIHPALLDAALHPVVTLLTNADADSDSITTQLPFAFTGVSLYATAATRLCVELTRTGPETFTLRASDPSGSPVITIDTLTLRAIPAAVSQTGTRPAQQNALPPIRSALKAVRRPATAAESPNLTAQTPEQQLRTLATLVDSTTAAVLGHPDLSLLDPDRSFAELGIESMTALELRNTLIRHTGLALSPTLIRDYPTPAALAQHLHDLYAAGSNTRGPIGQLVKAATKANDPAALVSILTVASRLASSLDTGLGAKRCIKETVLKSADAASQHLVCIAEFPGQYNAFANCVPLPARITEILAPGFSGTRLPATLPEAVQPVVDTLLANWTADQQLTIIANGITCILGGHALALIDESTTPARAMRGSPMMVAIAPIKSTADLGDSDLSMGVTPAGRYTDQDLIAYGRYLSFLGELSGDKLKADWLPCIQTQEGRQLVITKRGGHDGASAPLLSKQAPLLALRISSWIDDNIKLN